MNPGRDIPTKKSWQSELWRHYATGCDTERTKIQHIEGTMPKKNTRRTMPQVRTTGTLSQKLPETRWTQTIQRTSQELATREENGPLANLTKD